MSTKPSPEQSAYNELTTRQVSDIIEFLEPIRRRSRVGAAVLATSVGVGLILPVDSAIGQAAIENSRPIIRPIAKMPDGGTSDNPLIYIDGFARQDSSWQARNMLGSLREISDSSIEALENSKRGIHIDIIARTITERLNQEETTSVSLYGYSVGGDEALLLADALIHKYNIRVTTIYLDHTPTGVEDINSDQRELAQNVIGVLNIFNSFGVKLQFSWIARQIVNASTPENTTYTDEVSSSLMLDQFNLGASIDVKQAMENLKSDEFPTPVVVYVSSSDPDTDQVIDLVQSEKTFKEATDPANIPSMTVYTKGSVHGRPDLGKESYDKVFNKAKLAINALIAKSERSFDLKSNHNLRMRILFHQ